MAAVITAEVSTPWLQQAGLKIRSWHGTGMSTFKRLAPASDQEALEKGSGAESSRQPMAIRPRDYPKDRLRTLPCGQSHGQDRHLLQEVEC